MPSLKPEIRISANPEELSRDAADEILRLAEGAVRKKGFLTVALSGGSTPKRLYALLASEKEAFRAQMPWDRIRFFWGDERHVPPDHPDSNYRMVKEAMLSKVPMPPDHIYRIEGENPDAAKAAQDYEQVLREAFGLAEGQIPKFDLILLGMGADGHTASLFPETVPGLKQGSIVAASWIEKVKAHRITLTPLVLNNSAEIVFMIRGEEKAETLRAVLQPDDPPTLLPARLIQPVGGKLLWLVDQAAASLLDKRE